MSVSATEQDLTCLELGDRTHIALAEYHKGLRTELDEWAMRALGAITCKDTPFSFDFREKCHLDDNWQPHDSITIHGPDDADWYEWGSDSGPRTLTVLDEFSQIISEEL